MLGPFHWFKMKLEHYTNAFISDPVVLIAGEGSEVLLEFTEPGSGGPYEEITWYKGATGSSNNRIVWVHPTATKGQPLYYNNYCSDRSPCDTSTKGVLTTDTGEFTIHSVDMTDNDYYYYDFYMDGLPDTGHKYEIKLIVSGKHLVFAVLLIPQFFEFSPDFIIEQLSN